MLKRSEINYKSLSNSNFIDKVVHDNNINFMDDDKSYLIEQLDQQKLTRKDALDWIAFLSSTYGVSMREKTQTDVIEWTKIKEKTMDELKNKNATYDIILLRADYLYNIEEARLAVAEKAAAEEAAAEKAAAEKAAANLATLLGQGDCRWREQ